MLFVGAALTALFQKTAVEGKKEKKAKERKKRGSRKAECTFWESTGKTLGEKADPTQTQQRKTRKTRKRREKRRKRRSGLLKDE